MKLDRVYVGKGRPDWYGRRCGLVNTWRRKGPHNVTVEFADGERAVCPVRCIRKAERHGQG